jgi:hypothetical protein
MFLVVWLFAELLRMSRVDVVEAILCGAGDLLTAKVKRLQGFLLRVQRGMPLSLVDQNAGCS